jgi:hypothetical protein
LFYFRNAVYHQKHDLKDFNILYDEHSPELICHLSAIDSVNQDLISKEKEINRILTKEEKFEISFSLEMRSWLTLSMADR